AHPPPRSRLLRPAPPRPPPPSLFPYTTLFRSLNHTDVARFLASDRVQRTAAGQPRRPSSGNALRSSIRGLTSYLHAAGLTRANRSEEHTSELQSREKLVCRPLLEIEKSHMRTP